jgi:hypothetical protein
MNIAVKVSRIAEVALSGLSSLEIETPALPANHKVLCTDLACKLRGAWGTEFSTSALANFGASL